MDILIDFDGTCVTHDFPKLGSDIGSVPVLKELVENGHNLILFTMRGSGDLSMKLFGTDGLEDAKNWFKNNDIPLFGVQTHPNQHNWTNSPKAHGQLIIDDTALGIPIKNENGQRFVDWKKVRIMLLENHIIKPTPDDIINLHKKHLTYVKGDYVNFIGKELTKPEYEVQSFEVDYTSKGELIGDYLLVNVKNIHTEEENQFTTKDLKLSKKWK